MTLLPTCDGVMKSSRSVSLRAPLKPAISRVALGLNTPTRKMTSPVVVFTFDFVWSYQRVKDRKLTALAAGCAAQSS